MIAWRSTAAMRQIWKAWWRTSSPLVVDSTDLAISYRLCRRQSIRAWVAAWLTMDRGYFPR